MATGKQLHIDAPLTTLAVAAFQDMSVFKADVLFPRVPVGKKSDKYYTVTAASWLRIHDTRRAPKTVPNEIEFDVSSDSYFCDNHALRDGNALEDLANADMALALRETSLDNVVEAIRRAKERRVAQLVTSISNVGSGVRLSAATDLWSNVASADIVGQVNTAVATIRAVTGVRPNVCLIDWNSAQLALSNQSAINNIRGNQVVPGARLAENMLPALLQVPRVEIADAIFNSAVEGGTASYGDIWGRNAVFAYVAPNPRGRRVKTFGLTFDWMAAELGLPRNAQGIYVERYLGADRGQRVEWVESGYHHDEKIVAPNLCYVINTASGS